MLLSESVTTSSLSASIIQISTQVSYRLAKGEETH